MDRATFPLQALEDSFLPLLASGGCWHLSHMVFSSVSILCVSVRNNLCPFPNRIHAMAVKAHQDNLEISLHLKMLNLIRSAKILFPNQVSFTVYRDLTWILLGAIFWPTTSIDMISSSKWEAE